MSYAHLRVTFDDAIGQIVLTRPETRNAMSAAMGSEIERAVQACNAQPDVRVVLVRGEGPSFSSGGDFKMLEQRAASSEADNCVVMRQFYASFLSIRHVRVPTVAVLHGAVVGAGLCFAMACDLRIAGASAKLSANFVRVGLHPGMGATWLLPRLVGPAKATELLLTGDTLDGPEAHRIGLVNRVIADDELDRHAHALAERIAGGAPLALASTKATLAETADAALDDALDREALAQAQSFASEDLKEALRAFAHKRAPQFSGR